jgi:hypothetical protein
VYSSMITAMSAGRLRELREQAARERLVIQARRARREAAAAGATRRRRPWPRWWTRRTAAAMTVQRVPAGATPDQRTSALSVATAQGAGANDRQPAGGRAW